ncbi:signal peptide peptidase SppA [Tenacibaculum maritimum]|uniref:signal peptide peptidase SppA n=1 Tax=Tenacibaculum maritimum TaxID=107401 RepID=UPI0012E6494D|nr:signal peptide peptidase SppA [Tenacibaculum maritimum]CAA0180167.1 Protease IV; Signal peptide peptidase A [Tenacibaculum maritimum]
MNFLRNLIAAIIGFFIAIFLLLLVFIGIAAAFGNEEITLVKPNSVLNLDLSIPIKDYAPVENNPFVEAFDLADEKLGLNRIITAIENAKTDDHIKGITIQTSFVNAGIAQTQAIRDKIAAFKESGKFVYAYNNVYNQKNYYLSSVADSLFLNPIGAIDFKGLTTEILYYKDFEDKYGIKMEVIRHGKYKSAVEPYLSNKMSEANREQTTSFLQSIWSEILEDISESRKIPIPTLNNIATNSLGRDADKAMSNQLIDAAIYEDEFDAKVKIASRTAEINMISINDYIKAGKGRKVVKTSNKIAVIYAQGQIIYGKGSEEMIGQDMINKALKKAREDHSIKAIVLRVNSPGGSALASELIWRALELTKKEKPLVVSMGNLAASGGYYIACNANKIIAEPTTITGSIGVFGAVPNVHQLAENIGINAEQVSTNKSAYYSPFEPISKQFYEVTKEGVENIYKTFVNRVAAGRNMTFEEVDNVAQGRVWTGKEAVNLGLVDQLGSLEDAIQVAAELAEIDSYRIRNYPNYKKDLKEALKLSPFAKVTKEEVLQEALGEESYRLYKNVKDMKKLKGIQARLPFIFQIN